MGCFEKDDGCVRTRWTWLLVAAFLVTFGGVVLAGVSLVTSSIPVLVLVAYLAASLGVWHLWNRRWLDDRGHLRADDRGLWLAEALIVPRSAVRHAYVARRDATAYVRLQRMLLPVEVVVDDEEEGAALLAAMRLDAARSVADYQLNQGTYRSGRTRAAAWRGVLFLSSICLTLLLPRERWLAWLSVLWVVATTIRFANEGVRVHVGADGIRLRRLLLGSRFIPFGALESAETDGRDVTLRVRDSVIHMHHPAGNRSKPLLLVDQADEPRMLVERINAQAEQHRRAHAEVRTLSRGERDTRRWLRELAVASDEHASFREPAVPPDELWRVVEDPAADTTARAGAAFALRSRLDDAGHARLRVVAEACAAPKLRAALELAASDAEPEALERAFDELQDEPRGVLGRGGR